jgi:glutamate carboxypeptidase
MPKSIPPTPTQSTPSQADLLTQATDWLATQRTEMESLLKDLVEVSSWTGDKQGVDAATAILRKATPLPCESIASVKYGDHSVFHAPKPASQNGVILVGHIDTVFPKEKFTGYRSDGKIARGPGVLDMKGGLVIVTFALKALQQLGLLDQLALTYMVVSDEEVGSPDSTPHLRRIALGAKASLVFESGRAGDAIITRRKGTGSLTAVATGKAAHAGNAHREGVNAIWAISRFIDRLQGLTDYDAGTTINVGKVAGGIGKNTVPDQAEALVDLRYVTREESDALRARILHATENLGVQGAKVEVQWGPGRGPMEKSEAAEKLRASYAECQHESGLGTGEMGLVGGGSDAATTSALGVPSIDGLGPRGTGFHTLDEFVELDSFVPKAQALTRYLIKYFV